MPTPTSTGNSTATGQPRPNHCRPIYHVAIQRNRPARRKKFQLNELSRTFRRIVLVIISGCALWVALVVTTFLIFVTLFANTAGTILPAVLAHFP